MSRAALNLLTTALACVGSYSVFPTHNVLLEGIRSVLVWAMVFVMIAPTADYVCDLWKRMVKK